MPTQVMLYPGNMHQVRVVAFNLPAKHVLLRVSVTTQAH